MNDCTNAEMRDRLPDLMHERLDAGARAAVLAHVNGCADCRDELQLLRDVRGAFDRVTPRVDVAYVVGALPLPPQRAAASVPARRRVWADWRIAAAVTLIVAGGSSLAVLRSNSGDAPMPATDTVAMRPPVATPNATPSTATVAAAAPESAVVASGGRTEAVQGVKNGQAVATADAPADGRFSGLSEQQLKTLLGDIEKLQPVPTAEPEPVMIRVTNSGSPGDA